MFDQSQPVGVPFRSVPSVVSKRHHLRPLNHADEPVFVFVVRDVVHSTARRSARSPTGSTRHGSRRRIYNRSITAEVTASFRKPYGLSDGVKQTPPVVCSRRETVEHHKGRTSMPFQMSNTSSGGFWRRLCSQT